MTEARCPECGEWSEIRNEGPWPGIFWWKEPHAGCPRCGALVMVETECDFRKAAQMQEQDRERINFITGAVLVIAAILTAVGLLIMGSGCATTCKPMAARCHQGRAELCDGDGKKWRTVIDCNRFDNLHCVCKERCSCRPK